jgi:hypothetical protein
MWVSSWILNLTLKGLLKDVGAVKLLLFSVKFINYNDFSNFDAGETLHDW